MDFPHPIDVWVRGEKDTIAYWIIDTGIKTDARAALQQRFQQLGVHIRWIFTTSMLHEHEEPGRIILTTTERGFMTASRYDAIYERGRGQGRSLHYLDGSSAMFISFRGLHLVHSPHIFAGIKITHALHEMQVLRQSGGFVHPDEHAVLTAYRDEPQPSMVRSRWPTDLPLDSPLRIATCIFCGQQTSDYWLYNGATKTCRCRPCRDAGRA